MAEQDTTFGPNAWLVDEMYEQYRADPSSVSESWRDFFADGSDDDGADAPAKEPVQTDTAEAQDEKPAPKPKKKAAKEPTESKEKAEAAEQPEVIRHEHVGLGIAVDVEKKDGSRTLLVPCVKNADTLDFKSFWSAYEELIRKVRNNKLSPDDFSGTTMSLTNPGTIGTVQSVPRLMPGQAVIVGVGSLDYPAEY